MSEINHDEKYMSRCIELAHKGKGHVAPNPMVGAVIVHQGKIIGEGYHRVFGGPHAEVNAINSVKNKDLLKDSTIYVSLEPCSHHGKTPPCADLFVHEKIPHVVVGMKDPFTEVNGEGIRKLLEAGCRVEVGVLEDECRDLNREFNLFHTQKRPYIILKWAQTLDGFIDKERKPANIAEPNWITNEECRSLVHKWRTEIGAIMVGTNTARLDNPKLNIRAWSGKAPLRIVIDKDLSLPQTLFLFDNTQPTLVLNELKNENIENTEFLKIEFGESFIHALTKELYNRKIMSLFVEGGQKLLNSFIEQDFWDETRIFTGNKYFNAGTMAPKINGRIISQENLGDNMLVLRVNS